MITITETKTTLYKNPTTKTTYIVNDVSSQAVTEKEHQLTTNENTVEWFRRLGGSESVQKSYTCNGYVVTKLVSTSPDRQTKVVREFKFKSN